MMSFLMQHRLPRILAGGAVFLTAAILFEALSFEIVWLRYVLYIAAYLIVGADVVLMALRNITRGKIFDENFLMTLATAGAMAIGEFPEAVAVMLFYQVGELFQSYAVNRSRRSIAALMDIRPDSATVMRGELEVTVPPDEVAVGETLVIRPGDRIPLDGVVLSGVSAVDTSAMTGESLPRTVRPGDALLSGTVNLDGVLTATVTKPFGESTVNRVLSLVEYASDKKSRRENFISKFAKYYTPAVVIAAVLLAVLPPLIYPVPTMGEAFSVWIYRALTFLVVSCPCALVVSIPMSFFGGIGGASKAGVLVKGGNYLEALANAETVVFDKTGTLTAGDFSVQSVVAKSLPEDEIIRLAAYAESYSPHPISRSLLACYGKEVDKSRIDNVREEAGRGVSAEVDGRTVLAGNALLLSENGVAFEPEAAIGTLVYVAVDGVYAGCIVIADTLKADAAFAVSRLKSRGIRETVMLTGDNEATGRAVAAAVGIDRVHAQLLPAGKVERFEQILSGKSKNGTVVFVGDGVNDAPVLARADVGIAMGGVGSDAAIEAADIVIMADEPKKIVTAISIAKKTLRIVTQNIVFALGIKLATLILSAFGIANMWMAVFADVGVAFLAILNAFRALGVKRFIREESPPK